MLIIVYLLLMLRDGCCANYSILETKLVGDVVKLTCSRRSSGEIFWMRAVWGHPPEVFDRRSTSSHISIQIEPGTLNLKIIRAKPDDSGVYICLRNYEGKKTVLNATYLRIEEPAATITPTSGPVGREDTVTLQCSALHDSQNESCPLDYRVVCFNIESNQSQVLNSSKGNGGHGPENSSEGDAAKQCFYNFQSFSSSVSTYNCTVAIFERKISNKSKLDMEEVNTRSSRKDDAIVYLLSAALVISLIVIVFLLYFLIYLQKKVNNYSDASLALQTAAPDDDDSPQANEDSVLYSVTTFIRRKSSKTGRMDDEHAEEEIIYSDVKVPDV